MRSKKLPILGLVFGIANFAISQQYTMPVKQWDVSNGNPANYEQTACAVDPSGNLVYVGNHQTNNQTDIFLNCIHPNGNVAWQQTCASSPSSDDYGIDLKIDNAGNIYLTGAYHNGSNYDYSIAKYNSSGVLQWQKYYDNGGDDIPAALEIDGNGNTYVTGTSQGNWILTDFATLKFDSNGNQSWVERYDHNNSNKAELATDIGLDNSGNVIVCGAWANNLNNSHYLVVKYNNSGAYQASNHHNSAGTGQDLPVDMLVKGNGRVFITGSSEDNGNRNIKTVKYNTSLTPVWIDYIDANGQQDRGTSITNTNGGVAISGYVGQADGGTEFFVRKYDGSGAVLWDYNKEAHAHNGVAKATAITKAPNGGVIVAGYRESFLGTNNDFYTVKLDGNGNVVWERDFDASGSVDNAAEVVRSGSSIYVVGSTEDSGIKSTTTVKYDETTTDFPPDINGETANRNMTFLENRGQLLQSDGSSAGQINHYANFRDYQLFVEKGQMHLVFNDWSPNMDVPDNMHRVDILLEGSNANAEVFAYDAIKTKHNFYLGHTDKGLTDLESFQRLVIPEIYPNINLHLYSNDNGLKMYYEVLAGGNAGVIRKQIIGASSTVLNGVGQIEVSTTSVGAANFDTPVAYQLDVAGNIVPLGAASWNSVGGDQYLINMPALNPALTTIIMVEDGNQPLLGGGPLDYKNCLWSTYFGGDGQSEFNDVDADINGNAYYAGHTNMATFPIAQGQSLPTFNGGSEALVLELDVNMEYQWVTLIGGGTPASSFVNANDRALSVGVNQNTGADIYISGTSETTDFPINDGGGLFFSDATNNSGSFDATEAFISRFDGNGQLVWSTLFGSGTGVENLREIKLDNFGNVYAVGRRESGTLLQPLTGATNYTVGNGSLLKFDSGNQLLWANAYDCDNIRGIGIHLSSGAIHIMGETSTNLTPVLNSDPALPSTTTKDMQNDAFVARFDASGVLDYSFFWGGNCFDQAMAIDVDGSGVVTFAGQTGLPGCAGINVSNNLPVIGGGFAVTTNTPHFFLGRVAPYTGGNASVTYAGYIGGGGQEQEICHIDVTKSGFTYMTGITSSSTFALPPAIQMPAAQPFNFMDFDDLQSTGINRDGFIMGFDPNMNLLWSTYFGGKFSDAGYAVAASDNQARLYYAGSTFTNNATLSPTDTWLPIEDFDPFNPNDYYQAVPIPTNSYPAWAAFFDVNGITNPTGITENDVSSVNIFPNPSNDQVVINSEFNMDYIEVFDIRGKLVTKLDVNNKTITLSVTSWGKGLYIIQVMSDNKRSTARFVKN